MTPYSGLTYHVPNLPRLSPREPQPEPVQECPFMVRQAHHEERAPPDTLIPFCPATNTLCPASACRTSYKASQHLILSIPNLLQSLPKPHPEPLESLPEPSEPHLEPVEG